jgi:anti-sigma factor RsiW
MMICLRDNNQGADLLIGYLEGTLSTEDRRDLERHAAECAECRRLLSVQATLGLDVAPEVSANFDARLYARIAADQAQKPWWSLSWKMAAPIAAMAAALAVTVWVRQPVPQPANPVVAQDVQQLEQALDDLELLMPLETNSI